jgi:hypothetical protein
VISNYKIGADVEVFLRERETGRVVSAEGLIKGTKSEPFNFDESNKFFATSLDNVMAEFCIPPATTPAEFYFGIERALKYINGIIPKELETVAVPAAYLEEKYLQTENAKLFGCDPDFNAWTLEQNIPPGTSTNMRTCGGHIHIGYDNPNAFFNINLIKAMDIYVGVARAGFYREKSYGVEYRTVSNYYLQDKKLTEWAFNNTIEAINFVNSGRCNLLGYEEKEEIVNTINYNDKEMAQRLVDRYQVKLAA